MYRNCCFFHNNVIVPAPFLLNTPPSFHHLSTCFHQNLHHTTAGLTLQKHAQLLLYPTACHPLKYMPCCHNVTGTNIKNQQGTNKSACSSNQNIPQTRQISPSVWTNTINKTVPGTGNCSKISYNCFIITCNLFLVDIHNSLNNVFFFFLFFF